MGWDEYENKELNNFHCYAWSLFAYLISQVCNLSSIYKRHLNHRSCPRIPGTRLDARKIWLSSVRMTLDILQVFCALSRQADLEENLLLHCGVVGMACLLPSPSKISLTSSPLLPPTRSHKLVSRQRIEELIYDVVERFSAFMRISGNELRSLYIVTRIAWLPQGRGCLF